MSKAKYVADLSGPSDHLFIRATSTILFFLVVWILSMAVPIIIVVAIGFGYYKLAGLFMSSVVVAYMPWKRINALRPFFATGFSRYFKESSIVFEEAPPSKSTPEGLYCVHPHGIFCMGWGGLFARPEFEHVHFCFSSVLYNSPFFQCLAKLVGNPEPADKKSFQRLMKERKSMALIPGGFEEATIHCNTRHRVFCKNRCGFVKYALENGYPLIPIYCFGENQTYNNLQGMWKFRLWLNSLGFPGVMPFGTWWFPLLPKNKKMHIVVGKAIKLPCFQKPTKDQINEYHTKYVDALKKLFDDNKKDYGEEGNSLEVW
mmetsp:Transcript_14116/g.18344  ORF Transcript_14116/g.18344 Transcript_14116/m.18344 type:complete len:316 (+) Transcript_14116:56-1003(+)